MDCLNAAFREEGVQNASFTRAVSNSFSVVFQRLMGLVERAVSNVQRLSNRVNVGRKD